ncbi:MAG: SGNH/GDSL hydrolase family protein [Clostridia bacterium]|nr:SGNH/GDSL hydrolase family protein [Clostridia bacterium]
MRIEDIDKNLVVETTITEPDLVWFNVRELPFRLYGVIYDETMGCYVRMPQATAEAISQNVSGSLNRCTAGGRVRFRTDSRYIAIKAVMKNGSPMVHMPLTGQSGFDLYRVDKKGKDLYYRTFVPPRGMTEGYSSAHWVEGTEADYTINFPLYDGVKELYVALKRNAHLSEPTPYAIEKPVVYYGSSITQGGCASRPGNAYQAIISRHLGVDHINLGFSGSAKGELGMAEYIATLDMSAFVMDYDHNTNNEEHLKQTHEPFFKAVRAAHPTLPIIIVSAPNVLLKGDEKFSYGRFTARRAIVRRTYENALIAGDKNVYFIDGAQLFKGEDWDACTVDGTHPNDLGFFRMATRIGKDVRKVLLK